MKTKVLTLLGFAAKAGKLAYGFEAAVSSVKTGKSSLVLTAVDVSQKSLKEIKQLFFVECYARLLPYERARYLQDVLDAQSYTPAIATEVTQ